MPRIRRDDPLPHTDRELARELEEGPRVPDEPELRLDQEAGRATHALIGALCAAWGPAAHAADVWAEARKMAAGRLPAVYRQSARQRVATAAATYFREFARPGWRFEGAEVIVGDLALDLLWSKSGHLEADEIKSGLAAPQDWRHAVRQQAAAQADAARAVYGSAFRGVRAVLLAAPRESFLVRSAPSLKAPPSAAA